LSFLIYLVALGKKGVKELYLKSVDILKNMNYTNCIKKSNTVSTISTGNSEERSNYDLY